MGDGGNAQSHVARAWSLSAMGDMGDGPSLVGGLSNGSSLVSSLSDGGNDCHGNGSLVGNMPRNVGRPPGGDDVSFVGSSLDTSRSDDDVSIVGRRTSLDALRGSDGVSLSGRGCLLAGLPIVGGDGGGSGSATVLMLDLATLIGGSPSAGMRSLLAGKRVASTWLVR